MPSSANSNSSSASARSTTSQLQPRYNMDRFLAESAREAPYAAGKGIRRRSSAVINELDAILTQLERGRAGMGHH